MTYCSLALALLVATPCGLCAQTATTYTFTLLENYRDASGPWSAASAMSPQGAVVGQSRKRPYADSPTLAVRWKDSTAKRFAGTTGEWSSASGVNGVGHTVGYRSGGDGLGATLWEEDGSLTDLPALKGTETVLTAAAINDDGDVVGHGGDKKGVRWDYLWALSVS